MSCVGWVLALADQAAHAVQATVSEGADHSFCKWIIGGLAGAFASVSFIAYNWIRSLIKENKDERNERLVDLKDHYKPFSRQGDH